MNYTKMCTSNIIIVNFCRFNVIRKTCFAVMIENAIDETRLVKRINTLVVTLRITGSERNSRIDYSGVFKEDWKFFFENKIYIYVGTNIVIIRVRITMRAGFCLTGRKLCIMRTVYYMRVQYEHNNTTVDSSNKKKKKKILSCADFENCVPGQ